MSTATLERKEGFPGTVQNRESKSWLSFLPSKTSRIIAVGLLGLLLSGSASQLIDFNNLRCRRVYKGYGCVGLEEGCWYLDFPDAEPEIRGQRKVDDSECPSEWGCPPGTCHEVGAWTPSCEGIDSEKNELGGLRRESDGCKWNLPASMDVSRPRED